VLVYHFFQIEKKKSFKKMHANDAKNELDQARLEVSHSIESKQSTHRSKTVRFSLDPSDLQRDSSEKPLKRETIRSLIESQEIIQRSMLRAVEAKFNHLRSIDVERFSFPNENKPKTSYTYAETNNENPVMPNMCRRRLHQMHPVPYSKIESTKKKSNIKKFFFFALFLFFLSFLSFCDLKMCVKLRECFYGTFSMIEILLCDLILKFCKKCIYNNNNINIPKEILYPSNLPYKPLALEFVRPAKFQVVLLKSMELAFSQQHSNFSSLYSKN
jgi:hypothetical protein